MNSASYFSKLASIVLISIYVPGIMCLEDEILERTRKSISFNAVRYFAYTVPVIDLQIFFRVTETGRTKDFERWRMS